MPVVRDAAAIFEGHPFRKTPADLLHEESQEGPRPREVGGRHREIEAHRPLVLHEVQDLEVTGRCVLRHDFVVEEAQAPKRRGDHARALVLRLVEKCACRARHHGMGPRGLARAVKRPAARAARVVLGPQHDLEHVVASSMRAREESEATPERLIPPGVEDVEHRAHEELLCGEIPVILGSSAIGIDQHVGDVLDVADLVRTEADFEERVVPGSASVLAGGIEAEAEVPENSLAIARGERPVLALDVVDKRALRPGEERGEDPAHTLPGARGGKAEHVLGAAVAQVLAATPFAVPLPGQKDPRAARHAGLLDLARVRPASRAVAIALAAQLSCATRGKDDRDEKSRVGGDHDHPMAAREDGCRHTASPVAPVPDEEAPRGIERAYGKDPHKQRAQEKPGCQATKGSCERSHNRQCQQS